MRHFLPLPLNLFFIFILCMQSCRFPGIDSNEAIQKKLLKKQPFLTNAFNNHIGLMAAGEDPEKWSFTMNFDHSFNIQLNENRKQITSPTYPVATDKSNMDRYEMKQGGESIVITVAAPSHRNSSSRSVEMKIGNTLYKGKGAYSCNYLLQNNWMLQKVSRDTIKSGNTSAYHIPSLSFNLKKFTFRGYNGQHTFKGHFDIRGNILTFKSTVLQDINNYNMYPKMLDQMIENNACEYMINENILTLVLPDESRLFFIKK